MPEMESHEGLSPEKEERLINLAIRINFVANVLLLASKVAIMYLTSSMSMLAGLVDGVLDFLSTVIVWVTTVMIRRQDRNRFPITRRRLEPLSVLIFSVIMVTSFFQVGLTSINRLMGEDHTLVELSLPSIILMAATVIVKLLCWLWCRLIPSPGVQVLAQDAMTDVIFNTFSIIFPLSMYPPLPSLLSSELTHHSWLLRAPLVPRSPGWSAPLCIHHVELGINGE
jgi:divalent metal cation (Fe/Co/Zn/Cd) transporter